MGRPRKNSDTLDAKERIYQAFWELLNEHTLHEITIGMIASKAECNRGTFYYHFSDMDELISTAIDKELFNNGIASRLVLRVACGDKTVLNDLESFAPHFFRIHILAEKGGGTIIATKIKRAILKLWETVLGVDEGALNPAARLIIEYAVSGIIGVLSYSSTTDYPLENLMKSEFFIPFLQTNSQLLIKSICDAQGVALSDAVSRLKALVRFLEISDYSLDSLTTADTKLLKRLLAL